MKKMLMFCIMAVFAVCVSETHALGAPAAGNTCSYGGKTLAHMAREYISDCDSIGLANASVCVAYCYNGKIIYGIETCREGFFEFELGRYSENPDLYQRCGTEQQACESPESKNSGAQWNDARLRAYCDCAGKDKEWNKKTMRCEESENHKACTQPNSNARWDRDAGVCVCKDSLNYRWDDVRHECVGYMEKTECDRYAQMSARGLFDGQVRWNPVTRDCECIKDKDGNDITKTDDWWIREFGCEKKKSAVARDAIAANKPLAEQANADITKIVDDLKNISGAWERSRWKNAEGEFNTARLASDSIAGVVLGTVGGVITSNVIKKSQVKNGFEDLNCTIGGQRVADYGDQFRVGIQ